MHVARSLHARAHAAPAHRAHMHAAHVTQPSAALACRDSFTVLVHAGLVHGARETRNMQPLLPRSQGHPELHPQSVCRTELHQIATAEGFHSRPTYAHSMRAERLLSCSNWASCIALSVRVSSIDLSVRVAAGALLCQLPTSSSGCGGMSGWSAAWPRKSHHCNDHCIR
jgi:hypothetical protein